MSTEFDRDKFASVMGSAFTLTAAGGETVDIELVEVSELKETADRRSFAVLFNVPAPYRVEQGLFDLSHGELGQMQLFLVPVGIKDDKLQLEAVFNLLKDN